MSQALSDKAIEINSNKKVKNGVVVLIGVFVVVVVVVVVVAVVVTFL